MSSKPDLSYRAERATRAVTMRIDLAGRVAKIRLDRSQPLLPLVEAVINSLHAIDDTTATDPEIRITAVREAGIKLGEEVDRLAPIDTFVIEDNGIGFTDENQESFETSDSSYKRDRGGKGVGRLLWLRAFERAEVESTFGFGNSLKRRFTFALPNGIDAVPATPISDAPRKTTVKLIGLKDPWRTTAPRHLDRVATAIIEHCFLYFLRPNRPRMTLSDGFESIDLNQEFEARFVGSAPTHPFEIKGNRLTLTGFRMRPAFGKHQLIFTADFREVQSFVLSKIIQNLQSTLTANDGSQFWYLGVVQGPYLDANVNAERTAFVIPMRHEEDELHDDPTLCDIRDACRELIRGDLASFTIQIEEQKSRRLQQFVQTSQPKYRPFLTRYRNEVLAELPPDADDHKMDDVLHRLKVKKEAETRREARAFLESTSVSDDAEHSARVSELARISHRKEVHRACE
jgi:hypothetical protein